MKREHTVVDQQIEDGGMMAIVSELPRAVTQGRTMQAEPGEEDGAWDAPYAANRNSSVFCRAAAWAICRSVASVICGMPMGGGCFLRG